MTWVVFSVVSNHCPSPGEFPVQLWAVVRMETNTPILLYRGATCDPKEDYCILGYFIFPNLYFLIFWQPFKLQLLLHAEFPMILALEICESTERIKQSGLVELFILIRDTQDGK